MVPLLMPILIKLQLSFAFRAESTIGSHRDIRFQKNPALSRVIRLSRKNGGTYLLTVYKIMYTKFQPQEVSEDQLKRLINLYHLARVALSGQSPSRLDRMNWAVKNFIKENPQYLSFKRVYLDLEAAINS